MIKLSISDMHCASCVAAITKALEDVEGVTHAEVNFVSRMAEVDGKVKPDVLIAAVKAAGYSATVVIDTHAGQAEMGLFHLRLKQALVAAIVGIPLFIDMFVHWIPTVDQAYCQWFWLLIAAIVLVVMWYSGRQIYRGLWQSVKSMQGNMDTLVGMGTGVAWLYSVIVVVFPMYLPDMARHVYFDTTMMLLAFITFGNALEMRARGKTSEAICQLVGLQPKTAKVIRDGVNLELPIAEIRAGDRLRLVPGEQVAVDGQVIVGDSQINEAMLTGEPLPVHKQPGDKVYAGTVNQMGSVLYEATGVGQQTALARIIAMVERAQNSKPSVGRLVDNIASYFVPCVLLAAMLTLMGWAIWGPEPKSGYVLTTVIAVLVIACPCALGLATPIAIMVGVGKAAQIGILIRNGDALQMATKVDAILFDKTGTITQGKPAVVDAQVTTIDEKTLMRYVLTIEQQSEHPLARAMSAYAQSLGCEPFATIRDFKATSGLGVSGTVEGKHVMIGNQRFMQEHHIAIDALVHQYHVLAARGDTVILVAIAETLHGLIAIADTLKDHAKAAIDALKKHGLRVVMLTGDQALAANAIASQVGIDTVVAQVMPEDKLAHVKKLQAQGLKVAMVGDGINDAAALTQADVGIAMGGGADVAIQAADMALMTGSLEGVVNAITLSKRVMRNIKQNLFGAFIYNIVGISIAAGVFYPWLHLLLSPLIAGAAMALSSVTVVVNANRLRILKFNSNFSLSKQE